VLNQAFLYFLCRIYFFCVLNTITLTGRVILRITKIICVVFVKVGRGYRYFIDDLGLAQKLSLQSNLFNQGEALGRFHDASALSSLTCPQRTGVVVLVTVVLAFSELWKSSFSKDLVSLSRFTELFL